ncbi:Predicted arabinose efflux permease, MFS family [Nocardiopsis flavescens]|uniref:Predicted arabinose efflux permease, MFS family n=1 Tax=Nocardiopsis flavescens TaxID=758803 RepID=A0A1M6VUW9_9ACTN|nr:MFS transporter [Nocardiopsis flavescens]SHK85250.1 Predicted arabinose efflux permease, MFS family [Nocardiopsis flavescens]
MAADQLRQHRARTGRRPPAPAGVDPRPPAAADAPGPRPARGGDPLAPAGPLPPAGGPPVDPPGGAGEDGPPPLLRNRDFQALWSSRFLAGLGKESGEVAYPLLCLLLSGSAAHAGAIGAAQVAATMVAALVGGSLADRADRRLVLLCCDLGRLVLLGVFGAVLLAGGVAFPAVLAVAVCSSVLMGVSNPVAMAAVKQLVPPPQVADAAAQNQIRFFTTTALGAPAAGVLFHLGRAFPFLAEAAAYLLSAVLVLCIRRPLQAPGPRAREPWSLRGVFGGFVFLARHPVLRPMLTWIVGFNLAFTQTGAFLALIATAESRGADHAQIGLTVSLAGAGGLVGALVSALVLRRVRPSALFLAAAWSAPVCALALAAVPDVLSMGLLTGCVFALVPCVNAVFHGYIAASVTDEYQGRVLGAVTFLCLVSQPVGVLGVGLVFEAAGPARVFLAMAAVSGLAALSSLSPVMRGLPRPGDVTVP